MAKKHIGGTDIEPKIDISKKDLNHSVTLLNEILSSEFVLLVQTLNYHWNLIGPEFHDYHLLFNGQYHALFDFTDDIAERVRSLGGIAHGTMAEFIKHSVFKEDTGNIPKPHDMVKNLLDHHERIIKLIRVGVTKTADKNVDMATSNLLTNFLEKHEKMAWMLRSLTVRFGK